MRIALVFAACALAHGSEALYTVNLSAPGADWAVPGREAALAAVSVGGKTQFHIFPYAGVRNREYRAFVIGAGEIRVARDPHLSAPGAALVVGKATLAPVNDPAVANAPILYARPDTLAKFSDFPLLTYCEELEENGRRLLQYTVILTNEDGGTSTRALMARWGRTTDIEYVYRAYIDGAGTPVRATIQAKDHKEIEFEGKREGFHPVLYIATDNNMVAAEGDSPVRFQMAPVVVDLSAHSREEVMDQHPLTYELMAKELEREHKLRPFGTVDGEDVSDPRNYLYVEENLQNRRAAVATRVRLRGETVWRSADLGRLDLAISRDGWIRTTVELPPGTKAGAIEEIGFECLALPDDKDKWPEAGECTLDRVSKAFMLGPDYVPGPSVWSYANAPLRLQQGVMRVFRVSR